MTFNLDEKFILQVEAELEALLPQNYKTSMIKSNGGEIEVAGDVWEQYPIFDKSDRKRIACTCNHIIAETKSCEDFGNFPDNALAIAGNGCGDQLVLLKQSNSYTDSIYIWSHETGELDKVANDFNELTCL
ncbi:SMI1/KNR4 family protein [Endozoicomonas sp. G2_1]|uniref:SMI1/KNR4 family protein n=1 Tax=Endozoicomonas sp. G2_1 TaxID=2821091 RepID=UPI001ADB5E48|nr:SMI1/KNR4 family protein [Endozoicomonas sp. G2_1]